MALDQKLVSNINLRADGDQLLRPIQAFGREIEKAISGLNRLSSTMTKGSHKNEDDLRKQVQLLQRLIGEASTLQNIMNSAGSRRQNSLFSILDDQKIGKKALSASRLKQELQGTARASDALNVKLGQLNAKFAGLAEQGRRVGKNDMSKALNTEQAIRDVQRLEREMSKLDARAQVAGGLGAGGSKLRGELQTAYDRLFNASKSTRRVNFSTEIAQVTQLVGRYKQLVGAEEAAARAADRAQIAMRKSLLANVNQTESMLRSSLNRGAGQFAFSKDQARNADMLALGRGIDVNIAKLQRLQVVMSRALSPDARTTVSSLQRLQRLWEGISQQTSQALALRKAYENLPENRGKAVTDYLFGDGGLAFGTRIAGAMVIATGVGAIISAVQNGIRHVVQFEDELARLQAISGSTDQQMIRLGASIQKVASTSRYSTVEITQAATMIAQAGYSASETATVLADALELAAASGSSPTESVDTLTSALGAFQLQATESTRVVDTLVQGLNRSKLSINQMQSAIQYAGATARANGVRFEELTAVAASLANAGIRSGSTIGTGLRQLMVDLKTPTEDFENELKSLGLTLADVDVKALGLAGVVQRLTDAGFTAEAAYESFEVRAAASFLAFQNQIDVYDDLALSLAQTGASAEANEKAMDSLTAKTTRLTNNLLELADNLSKPVMDGLKIVADTVNIVVVAMNALDGITGGLASKMALVAASFAINPILGWTMAVFSAISAVKSFVDNTEDLRTAVEDAKAELKSEEETLRSLDQAMVDLVNRGELLKDNKVALQAEILTLTTRFGGLAGEIDTTKTGYEDLIDAMLRYRQVAAAEAYEDARKARNASRLELRGLKGRFQTSQELGMERRAGNVGLGQQDLPDDPTLSSGLKLLRSIYGLDADNLSADDAFQYGLKIKAAINDLETAKIDGEISGQEQVLYTKLLTELESQQGIFQELARILTDLKEATRAMGVYTERTSARGAARDQSIVGIRTAITEGDRANAAETGSGDAQINQALAAARGQIMNIETLLKGMDADSGAAVALRDDLTRLQALVGNVQRKRDEAAREADKNSSRDSAGARLSIEDIASRVEAGIEGARITQTTRSVAQQRRFDQAAGINRDASKAPHVTGNALDMAPISGMDPMEVVALLEKMGLQVTAAPVKRSGTRYVDPNHGTAPHWHFEWKSKTTQYERSLQQDADEAARELQQLLNSQAESQARTARAGMDATVTAARGGNISLAQANSDFAANAEAYRRARLNQFDVANPAEGLSDTLRQQRDITRAALEEEVSAEIAKAQERLWKAVGDYFQAQLDAAIEVAETNFDRSVFDAEQAFAEVESQGRTMDNERNRTRFGVGSRFIQSRRERDQRLSSDRDIVGAYDWKLMELGIARDQAQSRFEAMPEGTESKAEALKELQKLEQDLLDVQTERNELQRSINERTQEFADIPLAERLQASVQAWAENAGAMDSWGKKLENSIGPVLDNFTGGLADMFMSLADGSKKAKQALKDFLAGFARFIAQMITKMLALAAVKLLLKSLGLDFDLGMFEGGEVGGAKGIKNSFTGGPVEVEGRYAGGQIGALQGGGAVNRGVQTKDSALYNLAKGEYVVRNKSVRELGLPFMDAINDNGAKGAAKFMGGNTIMNAVQAPRQETNVYVVQDKKDAQMGPNDVLVTVQEDILTGGPTKRLIKQVAQGG